MRSLFAGVAVLVLAGACAMSAESPSASMAAESVKERFALYQQMATTKEVAAPSDKTTTPNA